MLWLDCVCFYALNSVLSEGPDVRPKVPLAMTLCWCARYALDSIVSIASQKMRLHAQVVRVTFAREVVDERDARSTLTMLAQLAWERERNYVPVVPQIPDPVGK